MPGHLLVLEGPAGILPVAGGAQAAMADRDAVARLKPGEIPTLHAAGKTLALRDAAHIDDLAHREMRGRQCRTRLQQRIVGDTKLHQLCLRLHLRLGEMPAVGLRHVLHLGGAPANLHRGVAVLLLRALRDDLQPSMCSTVTGTCVPSSRKIRVMPSFFASSPVRRVIHRSGLDLDLDIDTRRRGRASSARPPSAASARRYPADADACGSRTARGFSCRHAASG